MSTAQGPDPRCDVVSVADSPSTGQVDERTAVSTRSASARRSGRAPTGSATSEAISKSQREGRADVIEAAVEASHQTKILVNARMIAAPAGRMKTRSEGMYQITSHTRASDERVRTTIRRRNHAS